MQAEEIPIPDFALQYIKDNLAEYHPPKGQLYEYIREYFKQHNEPTKPWSISADFNGDTRQDWAGILVDQSNQLHAIVILSFEKSYTHKLLMKKLGMDSDSIGVGLSLESPGTVRGFPFDNIPEEDLTAELDFPGVHLLFYEKASVLYYWKDGAFRELWTSD